MQSCGLSMEDQCQTSWAMQGGPFIRVTKFKNDHIHNGQDMLGMRHSATARRTSTIIIDEVRDHIDKKPKELMTTLSREYGVKLTYKQAYRAKEKALEEIQGSPSQSYMMIPWICRSTPPPHMLTKVFTCTMVGAHLVSRSTE